MKLNFLSLVVTLFILIKPLSAQQIIKGHIQDAQTKQPLAGVVIHIGDLKISSISNDNGDFSFQNLKSGEYLIELRLQGYKTIVQKLNLNTFAVYNFELSTSVKELNEVIVTAVSRTTELKNSPIIVTPIDVKKLNQNSSTNLIDALKNIPGINAITTGNAISKPTIRGLGYNRVITLNNGIKQEGQQWGDEHGIEIDEYSVNRIEIIKGPGSLMYGSDGIAGVINFISPQSPPLNQVKTSFISNYQTNSNLIGYSISNAGNKNGLQWLGRFSNKIAGNYQNVNDGKVFNSGFKELNGSLFLGINKKWGYSHLTTSSFNSVINMVEGERDELGRFIFLKPNADYTEAIETVASKADLKGFKLGFPHQEINHLAVTSNNYFITKNGSINFDLGYQNNKRKEFADVLNPLEKELYFNLNTINYHLRYNLNPKNNWETTLGVSGMFQQNKNKGIEFLIPAYTTKDVGMFVTSTKDFKNGFIISGGLRLDNRNVVNKKLILDQFDEPTNVENELTTLKFNSFKKNYHNVSGSLGLSYQASQKSSYKFNISRGFRAPNIAEIASNGKHEGSFRYEYGNANLTSEISHQFDFAYHFNSDHVTIELTPFTNFISNYIFVKKLQNRFGQDSIPNPEEPAPAFKYTQGNATLIGGEIYFDIHPHPFDWLHIENTFSFVQATQENQTDSTKNLPFIPAPRYRAELRTQLNNTKILKNAYVKIGLDYFFKQNNVFSAFGTETKTPSYTLLNMGFGFDIKTSKKDALSLFFSGENLADIAYQNHLSRLKYAPVNPATGLNGIFNMGRNFSIKVIYSL